MSVTDIADIPLHQQAIRARCFHPTGTFVEFKKEETEQSIPDRFEQQVRRYPKRPAVKTKNEELTYDGVNGAANRVARAILARRGKGEEPVALLFEQGSPAMVAILGVLKSGKFYVPLDPLFPHPRTRYMLEDSQADLIVTNNQYLSMSAELAGNTHQVLNIDELSSGLSPDNLELPIAPNALSDITYTSGSTGQVKGVIQNHRNVLLMAMNYINPPHVGEADRVALLSFGGSWPMKIIIGALLPHPALSPLNIKEQGVTYLADWLIREEITVLFSGSPLFRRFCETLTAREEFPHLRFIRLGSQTVTKRDVELYKKHFSPDCVLMNGLASTETGLFRSYFIDKETQITTSTVPVGYPDEGKEVLLLDENGVEVSLKQVGEIAVRSRYLSPGYWRRPDLTRAAFLPDTNGGDQRIVRTGDLGRMQPDGRLEHLGRKDFRVKIRGFTVEVTEIEMALLDIETIKEALVMAHEDRTGNTFLVAYIVNNQQPFTISELRRNLKEKLPDYMVPSAFVFLDALPQLPNGKVDRAALPAPGSARPELENAFVAPRTQVEAALIEIWTDVLGLEQVGINDSFLELGGDSLLATQIISRVIGTFLVELPLRFLLETSTVADMAVVITQNQAKQAEPAVIERMMAELEGLSDEQARQLLANVGPAA